MIGKKFGKRIVINAAPARVYGKRKDKYRFWLCQCECGLISEICEKKLKKMQSLACVQCTTVKHGYARNNKKTPEFLTWQSIKRRCSHTPSNKRHSCYKFYAERGISVCDRWMNSFENFLADMGEKPSGYHSIDRIDSNGNYEPSNCRWVTNHEQNRNKRNNVIVTFRNKKTVLHDACKTLGIHTFRIWDIVKKEKIGYDEAFQLYIKKEKIHV